jgi:hypothetical protein
MCAVPLASLSTEVESESEHAQTNSADVTIKATIVDRMLMCHRGGRAVLQQDY